MPPRLRAACILVVTGVWAANFAAPVVVEDYTPPPEVHVVFMALVGILAKAPAPPDDTKK